MKRKKILLLAVVTILSAAGLYFWRAYRSLTVVPTTRIHAGSHYPEMPPDEHHHYLQIPVDHADPARGTFTDFYILGPAFKRGREVIFWLFDNQQERVGLIVRPEDFQYFTDSLGGLAFVLIGNRGVAPTLFPEVYDPDGKPNYRLAMKLHGSAQQVDDIEAVRRDMESKGLLPPDGKIMLYGGSGGGFLVQQYLDRYGSHVSRALIESSGAPDLAQRHDVTFARSLYDSNPQAANKYFLLSQRTDTTSLSFMLFKLGLKNDQEMQIRLTGSDGRCAALESKLLYLRNWFKPAGNFSLVRFLLSTPSEIEVKVRIYELLGADLKNYHPAAAQQVVLMYEWTRVVLADFLRADAEGKIAAPRFQLNRSTYSGEVMVWTGTGDQDFSNQMGQWISQAYPNARLAVFGDAHERVRHPDYYRRFREAFFTTGLHSPQTQSCFDDARQLIHDR